MLLVNRSRHLAIQLDAVLPADDRTGRSEYARLIGNFAIALSGHLRGGVDLTALVPPALAKEPLPARNGVAPDHVPAAIAREIVCQIHVARRDGTIDGTDVVLLKSHTVAILDVADACERIGKTPIPFSSSVIIKLFIVFYALILPVGLVPEYGYLAVPLTMLIMFALLGLELMAEEIEDPFGLDCNDLPTGAIAGAIRLDALVLLGLASPGESPVALSYSKVF